MGPKKEKKDKKDKKAKEKPHKPLKKEFEARIAERNALLAAARKKIQKIEDVYFETERKYNQTQEDMADVLKFLQHEIQENEAEILVYDEKIAIDKEEMNKNDKYYKSIFTTMEADFEEKEKSLQYQIQQNTAKLSAFEEVRHLREEFLKKKEQIFKKMQEMKERHEKELYETDRQSIIKQDTMRTEMEYNLVKLATDFRQATDIAIGETTNKLIRENIQLGNMLTCTQDIFERARDTFCKIRELEKEYSSNTELLDDEHNMILRKYTEQVNKIEALLKSHEELYEKIKASERLIKDNRRLLRQIAEKECILKEKIAELDNLLRDLNENNNIFTTVKNSFINLRKNVVDLEGVLFETAVKVKTALDVENINRVPEDSEENIVELTKEEQEDNLKEYKYKTRQTNTEEAVEKLGFVLKGDLERKLSMLSSEPHFENQESVMTMISHGK